MNQIAGFDIVFLIANGFGLLSTLCFIISFQIKSNKKLYVVQSIANIFYGIQFYLLGAYGGLFNMAMQIFRNLLLCPVSARSVGPGGEELIQQHLFIVRELHTPKHV